MKLNKNSSYVLLLILSGSRTAPQIGEKIPAIDIRSVQRALTRLIELGIIIRQGKTKPIYAIHYKNLFSFDVKSTFLEDDRRPTTRFNREMISWLTRLTHEELEVLSGQSTPLKSIHRADMKMNAKELEYLTIELAWKSSSLEGNTYTLLDTQLLLVEGIKAQNRTEFETQMILNHKNAIAFIIEQSSLFTDKISFATVEELHKIVVYNLGIAHGIRKKPVGISASNYRPIENPHQLKESALDVLSVINQITNPFVRALLTLSLIPYLQAFDDGNKRLGRMLANAILIHSVGRGFSLRKTDAKELALAYLAFYEFNSIRALSKIFIRELV